MTAQGSNLLLSIFLFLATFFHLCPATIIPDPTAVDEALLPPSIGPTSSNAKATAFIQSHCRATRYPDVCYSSLSTYADNINEDEDQLTRFALSMSVIKGRGLIAYLANLIGNSADDDATFPIHHCSANLSDVVDQVHDALKQVRQMNDDGDNVDSFKLEMKNLQTWMKAELTIVDVCTKGIDVIQDPTVRKDIETQVTEFKKLTTNGLGILNGYANKVVNK